MADFQAAIKTELIGKDLTAAVQKANNITCYAILPKRLEKYDGLELSEAIDQVGDFVKKITKKDEAPFTAASLQETIGEFIELDKVRLVLRQAYLFKKSGSENANDNVTEYAFNIAVVFENGEPEQKEGSLFKVKELSFAVWSCDRQAILDTMDIIDLSDIDKAIENAAQLEEKKKTVPQISVIEEQEEMEEPEEVEKVEEKEPKAKK